MYQVIANPAYPGQTADFRLSLSDPARESVAQQWNTGEIVSLRRFRAAASCEKFTLLNSASGPSETPMYFSVGCLDCSGELTGKDKLVQNLAEAAGLSVTPSIPAKDLITNVLIGGDCFDVSDITSKGFANSQGTFADGQSTINISEGIILCTGAANIVTGPNSLPNSNGGFGTNSADDPHLSTLTSGNQYDVSVIEFDFKPTADMVQFDFVFGSEEYCEYVNSIYNDVFGFFISGPGINGVKNIAVLPDGVTPVAINSVNHLTNSAYYRNNNTFGTCYGLPVTNMAEIQLDGFTKVLTATANLIPCETYHIKLAIADIGDANFASAVFLRANSFDAGGRALADAIYPSTVPYTREGCQDGYIRFYRGTGDASQPLVVNYTMAPGNTATPGLDFDPLPTTVTIPAGQTEVLIPVHVLEDQLVEGTERFTLFLDNSCSCDQQEVTFVIEDQVPLDVIMADQTGCAGNATLSPVLNAGGLPPLSYAWNDGSTGSNLVVSTFGSSVFTVTVTDMCGFTAAVSAVATVDQTPTAYLSGDVSFCPGNTASLTLNFTGVGPWNIEYLHDGVLQTQNFSNNPADLVVGQSGIYSLVSVQSQAGCPGLADGTGTAQEVQVTIDLNVQQPPCFGDPGAIGTTVSGNFPPYTYSWNTGADTPDLLAQPAGTYTLTVTTPQGCTAVSGATLVEPLLLDISITSASDISCYNPVGDATVEVQGGTGGYQYNWSTGSQQSTATFTVGGTYSVTVLDANQCFALGQVAIAQNTTPPDVIVAASDEITCSTPEVLLSSTGSSTGTNYIYAWTTLNGHIMTDMEEPTALVDAPGQYTLVITNTQNGCTASALAIVTENTNYPEGLEFRLTQPGCSGLPGTIRVENVMGGEAPFVFSLDGGNSFLTQSAFGNLQPGQYAVLVQDINGCEFAETVELVAPVEPEVTIDPVVTLEYGQTAELTAVLNLPISLLDTIMWAPQDGLTPTSQPNIVLARPFKNNWYTVRVISIDGCVDEAQFRIIVGKPDIYAPNVFKPSSSDGQNHEFRLFARSNTVNEIARLQIFDRWGNQVYGEDHFHPNDDRTGRWDGKYNDKILEPGVFTWWADVELVSGEHIHLQGDVTLVD